MTNIRARQPYARRPSPQGPLKPFLDTELANIQRGVPVPIVRAVFADDTVQASDDTIEVDATAGPVTITLPPADRLQFLRVTITRVDTSSHLVLVAGTPSPLALWGVGDFITVQSDGLVWLVIARAVNVYKDITWYGAVGDGVADDTAAIQDAADAVAVTGGSIVIPPARVYWRITDKITIASNVTVRGCGLAGEVRQDTSEKQGFYATGASNVSVLHLAYYGKGNYSPLWTDDNHLDRAVHFTICTNIRVEGCTLRNCALSGVWIEQSSTIKLLGNTVIGTDAFSAPIVSGNMHQYAMVVTGNGIAPVVDVAIANNDVSFTAFGIDCSVGDQIAITGNVVHDIKGQHGMYIGTSQTSIAGNTVIDFASIGIKVFYGTVGIQHDVSVTGNTCVSSTADNCGIEAACSAGGTLTDVAITGNTIRNTSATPTVTGMPVGIVVAPIDRAVVADNTISDVTNTGILVDTGQTSTDLAIRGNVIRGPQANGIGVNGTVTRLRIIGNSLSDGTSAGIGIVVASTTDAVISNNQVNGFFDSVSLGASATNVRVRSNQFLGYAAEPLVTSGDIPLVYADNDDGFEVSSYAATATAALYDRYIKCNGASAGFNVTLPDATKCKGRGLALVKIDATANAVGFARSHSQTINGGTTLTTTTQWAVLSIMSDGSNWINA